MDLRIKNAEAVRLAHELAALTGESIATAVTEALRERLAQVRQDHSEKPLPERLMAIGRDAAKRFKEPFRSIDHGDLLYGDDGLPR